MTNELASAAPRPRCWRRSPSMPSETMPAGDDGDARRARSRPAARQRSPRRPRRSGGQTAHDRIGHRQFAVAIGAGDQRVVRHVDEAGGEDVGLRPPWERGQGTASSARCRRRHRRQPPVAAAFRSRSRRTSAFQPACSTAATISAPRPRCSPHPRLAIA